MSESASAPQQISEGYYESNHQQLSEISREDILRQVFGDVGDLIDDFSCAVETTVLLHGRMYLTSRFLCFYSNLFGLEKKIRIPYSHITSITKENTALVIPNAIAITTYRKEYVFRSFWDRDECFRILKDFIDAFKRFGQAKVRSMSAQNATSSNSSPDQAGGGAGGSATATSATANGATAGEHQQQQQQSDVRPRSVSEAQAVGRANKTDNGGVNFSSGNAAIDDDSSDDEGGEDESTDSNDAMRGGGVESSLESAFNDEVLKSRLRIKVASQVMPISVADFANLFVDDNAEHSWLAYHQSVNDTSLECSLWKDIGRGSIGRCREIKFFKPVNLPGLKSTRGVKVQRCRRFGDYGLVVCSSTRLDDVPAADTFSVEDVITVQQVDEGNSLVEITFEVKFLKTTIFRMLIDRSTTPEMTKWLEVFFSHVQFCVEEFRKKGGRAQGGGGGGGGGGGAAASGAIAAVKRNRGGSNSSSKSESAARGDSSKNARAPGDGDDGTAHGGLIGSSGPAATAAGVVANLFGGSGRVFLGAWVVLFLSLVFCAGQWNKVNARLDRVNARLDEVTATLGKILKNQEQLSTPPAQAKGGLRFPGVKG